MSENEPFDDRYDEPEPQSNIVDLQEFKGRNRPKMIDISDGGLADMFVSRYGGQFIYVGKYRRWFVWDKTRWVEDEELTVSSTCSEFLMRQADKIETVMMENAELQMPPNMQPWTKAARLAETKNKALALREKLRGARKRDDVLRSAIPYMNITADTWNGEASISLLNTPSHTIELTEREPIFRDHRPSDYITKITAVAPLDMPTPMWNKFLRQTTNGDKELERFLQRMCGYMLTGDTSEQALFFGHGPGQTGKSTFVTTISELLGSYSKATEMSTFMEKQFQSHSTEIASLAGSRLVTASETQEGRRWNSALLKQLTGQDKVTARYMRQDEFTFKPQFKMLIVGNNRPKFSTVDEAIRRRFHLIPFTHRIPTEERDSYLTQKLRREWPGILMWMITGYAQWRLKGLAPPAVVQAATADYFSQEDDMERWFKECCEVDPEAIVTNEQVKRSYSLFCQTESVASRGPNKVLRHIRENPQMFSIDPNWTRSREVRGFKGFKVTNLQGSVRRETDDAE